MPRMHDSPTCLCQASIRSHAAWYYMDLAFFLV